MVRRLTREGAAGPKQRLLIETLLNLHAAPRHSCLGRLADVVSRMDNLSHVLVWAAGDARPGEVHGRLVSSSADCPAAVTAIEWNRSCGPFGRAYAARLHRTCRESAPLDFHEKPRELEPRA